MRAKNDARPRRTTQPGHVTHGNVLDDLFSPEESAAIKLKMQMHRLIVKRAKGVSRDQLENLFETSQPRVSDLLNGKLAKFSLEMLIAYAERLGIHSEEIKVQVSDSPFAYA